MKIINRLQAYIEMQKTNGHFFTVQFIKKGGEIRKMNCRLGVKKGLTGKGLAYKPLFKGLICVFDTVKKEYRMINLNTVFSLKANKKEFWVNDILAHEHEIEMHLINA